MSLKGGKDVGSTTRKIMAALMTNSLAGSFNFFGHDAKHAFSALHLRDVVTGLFNQLCIRAVPGKKPHSLGGQHLNVDHSTPRMYRYPRPPVSQDF